LDLTREVNQPQCPIYDSSCNLVGKLPRDEAKHHNDASQTAANAQAARGQGGQRGQGCSATRTPRAANATLGLGTMFLALTALRARRRARRKR